MVAHRGFTVLYFPIRTPVAEMICVSPVLLFPPSVKMRNAGRNEMAEKTRKGEKNKEWLPSTIIGMGENGDVHCSEDNFVTQSFNIFQQIPFNPCRKSLCMSSL